MEMLEKFCDSLLLLFGVTLVLFFVLQPAKAGMLVGDSMHPTIEDGDMFIYETNGTPQVGDVIVFDSDEYNGLIAHRVVKKNETHLVTKGDNNNYRDNPIKRNESVYLGTVETHVSNPWGAPVSQTKYKEEDSTLTMYLIKKLL